MTTMTAFSDDPVLDIRRLVKHYGKHEAVRDISFQVRPGEIVGFLGPNGAGKTTSLKIIGGLLLPTSGDVRICGRSIADDPVSTRRLLGYVPDRPFVYERLTGNEFLDFIADLYELHRPEATRDTGHWLKRFGLASFADERIEQYSHGMKQRLVMAAAFFRKPRALVIDEPMVGLDPQGARLVKSVFRETADKGAGVVLSTHSLAVAEQVCDRVVILHKGRIIAEGALHELRGRTGLEGGALEDVFLALTEEQAVEVGAR